MSLSVIFKTHRNATIIYTPVLINSFSIWCIFHLLRHKAGRILNAPHLPDTCNGNDTLKAEAALLKHLLYLLQDPWLYQYHSMEIYR